MKNEIKFKEIGTDRIKCFQRGDEPEIIYIIPAYGGSMVVHDDGWGIRTGETEILDKETILSKYGIEL